MNRVGTENIGSSSQTGAGDGTGTESGIPTGRAHWLCGKVHQFGKCGYKCKTCGKPHKEEQCWIAHPEKAPRNFKSPRKDHQRGRDNSKDRQKGRNRSNSKERGGDRDRPKSPRDVTGRVTAEDTDRELAKLLQKLENAQTGNKVNRVRKQLFEDSRREEENYRED